MPMKQLAAFSYAFEVFDWQIHCCRTIYRYADIPCKRTLLQLPVTDNLTIGRLVTAVYPVHTLDDARPKCEMLEPGLLWIG